jgi:hypothetical protein
MKKRALFFCREKEFGYLNSFFAQQKVSENETLLERRLTEKANEVEKRHVCKI